MKTKFIHAILNVVSVYTIVILMKLFYFSIKTGGTGFIGLKGLVSLGSLLVLISFAFLFRARHWYMGGLNVLLSILIFCDLVFYRYFNDLVSVPMLFQAGDVGDVQNSVLQLLHWTDLLLFADILFAPIIKRFMTRQKYVGGKQNRQMGSFVVCLAVGALVVFFGFYQLVKSQPAILKTFYDRVYVAQNIGLLNYHAADIYTFAAQSASEGQALDEGKNQEILEYFVQSKLEAKQDKLLYGAGKGKNLIVIQVEALQQFVINRSINGQEITPNLNKLAAQGIYFDNYYYQTAGGGTSDAEFTSQVSMFPMKEGAVYIRKPGNYYYSLSKKLKETGYSTMALHGYKPGFWNRSLIYKNLGIDEFYSKSNLDAAELLGMGISDKSFFTQAVTKLKSKQQPYYAFLITLSSHFPYDNDKSQYSSFDVGEYKDTLIGDYLEALHYTDEALGHFIDGLQKEGILQNTVVAVYGDHHGIPKDNKEELEKFLGGKELNSTQWQQLQKVPMMISIPGQDQALKISTVGGGIDFMPTILNIMGIDNSNMPSLGRDLINSEKGLVVFRNGSFIADDMIYISNENTCYELSSGATLDKESYIEQKKQADQLLEYSDAMIKYDMVKQIKEVLESKQP